MAAPEHGYDRQRAEWLRVRYRVMCASLGGLVAVMFVVTPRMFGSVVLEVSVMGATCIALAAQFWWLRHPRSYHAIERSAVVSGMAVVISSRISMLWVPDATLPRFAVTMLIASLILPAVMRLSARYFALHVLTDVALVTFVLSQRDTGFVLVSPVVLALFALAGIVGALDARQREQLGRREFEQREELERTNAALRQQEQARSRLFVNLSHDFRTPLTLVRGEAEGLLNRLDTPEASRAPLRRICADVDVLTDLIEQLLELARLDAGRVPLQVSDFALDAVVSEVCAQLDPGTGRLRLVSPPPLGAKADARHVRRILVNLIANALRQLEHGAHDVQVEVKTVGERVCVEVSDDGRGVPAESRAAIFERFKSLDSDGTTVSGIGLPLARELAELNAGTLELVEASRTTFRVALPKGVRPEVTAGPQRPRDEEPAAPPLGARPDLPPLLVVEDNPAMAELLARAFEDAFDVVRVSTVGGALGAVDARPPRAVLSDVMLGEGSGIDLVRALKERPALRDVPVLLVSALAAPEHRVRGLDAGADDYLAKPFSTAELRARLFGALARADSRTAAVRKAWDELLMELHDGVKACLSRASILLSSGGGAAEARAAVREALDESDAMLRLLEGAAEPLPDLLADLRSELASRCEHHALKFDFQVQGDAEGAPAPATAHTLRRVAHEAVTNVVKHANARRVRCAVALGSGGILLRVEDDGVGFDPGNGGGRGLGIIKRRAERLGGGASFGRVASGGAYVEVRLPA
jgi:signal transduction histidine kinase